ncbi:hypothetical protein BDV26DRAFT_146514 [Aspergillus bertholletiae]|uniref:Uncharacterized protein n=1 Tax=Aspergillus bertholletiae TaxID=1226010 RepID=A0A5N7AMM4_9EURO|nr:hypothetical protein BDV26DRAFT_146514 [Aspergillus bertholletiae]
MDNILNDNSMMQPSNVEGNLDALMCDSGEINIHDILADPAFDLNFILKPNVFPSLSSSSGDFHMMEEHHNLNSTFDELIWEPSRPESKLHPPHNSSTNVSSEIPCHGACVAEVNRRIDIISEKVTGLNSVISRLANNLDQLLETEQEARKHFKKVISQLKADSPGKGSHRS